MRAVDARMLAARHLARLSDLLPEPLRDGRGRIRVMGAGKAAAAMAAAAEEILGADPRWRERFDGGLVVVPEGYALPLDRIELRIAAHPLPDARSEAAGREMLARVGRAAPEDVWIGLWSGGTSALVEVPEPDTSLARIAAETARRMAEGVPIGELNAARRRWSAVKGGKLAAAGPAPWLNLVLSDVAGDDPADVGSGPAIPPGDRAIVVGSSRDALEAARAESFALRYAVVVLDEALAGEAREAGARLAAAVRAIGPPSPPLALLMAGEPVVTGVPEGAVGGRMQELALAAALGIEGCEAAVLATSTDGRDGRSDASGALVDGESTARMRAVGHDPERALAGHAATAPLAASGDLLRTGPTRTNVRDLVIALIAPQRA